MIPLAVPEDIIPARNSTRKRQQAPRPPSSQNVRPYVKYAPLKREDLIRSWRESGRPPGGQAARPPTRPPTRPPGGLVGTEFRRSGCGERVLADGEGFWLAARRADFPHAVYKADGGARCCISVGLHP